MKRSIAMLELLCEFALFCEREIEYFQTPFPEICEKFGNEEIVMLRKYAEGEGENPLFMSSQDEKTAVSFFNEVGGAFFDDSLKICRYTYEALKTSLDKAREEFPKQTKAEMSLALLVGAGASVILM